jgi:hypothetical protein
LNSKRYLEKILFRKKKKWKSRFLKFKRQLFDLIFIIRKKNFSECFFGEKLGILKKNKEKKLWVFTKTVV